MLLLSKKKNVRIGLLGMYASANLGDTAIQTVVLRALNSRRSDIDFVGISNDPQDVANTFGIPGFASSGKGRVHYPEHNQVLKKSNISELSATSRLHTIMIGVGALLKIERLIRELDMLIISGGGQIDDYWGGPWVQPFRLLAWCFFAKIHDRPIAVFAVGVDDLRSRISAWFVSQALQMAKIRVFRDKGSLSIVKEKGLKGKSAICPDPAFACILPKFETDASISVKYKSAVISPISNHAFEVNDDHYSTYLATLASISEDLLEKGYEVRFVCSQTKMDPPIALNIISRIGNNSNLKFINVKTVDEFLSSVKGADIVIASRLHAVILSLISVAPVLAISPARKVKQLMADFGLDQYCIDIDKLKIGEIQPIINNIIKSDDILKSSIALNVKSSILKIEKAFDDIAEFIPAQ